MTTLKNSYCVPRTVEEWDIFGLIPLTGHKVMWLGGEPTLVSGTFNDRTEIPVSHFLDLLHDRIVPWRLEEVGFVKSNNSHRLQVSDYSVDWVWSYNFAMVTGPRGFSDFKGITTFTDLLTLIRMLTPPPEET